MVTPVLQECVIEIPLGRIAALRVLQHPQDKSAAVVPRVLALHGWLDNAASFLPLAPHLHGIELVAPDLPGHGRSVHLPPGADYSFAGAVNDVLDITDALGWDRFSLLGHSIEALGALAETPERTVQRMREAVAATRALRKRLRVFADVDSAIRARMLANALSEPVARLLVERGLVPVQAGEQPGGHVWSSDPRLTLPTMLRPTEPQVRSLVAGIECPTRVIYADPAQPYLPDALRRERAALLPRGEMFVLPGGHHLHMEEPRVVAAAIGDFFTRDSSGQD